MLAESESGLESILYVSLADGKRIQPGMTAKISPHTVRSEEYGMLVAEVVSVEQLPQTQSDMLDVVGNDALVQTLSSSGLIIEVSLQVTSDASTPTGYQWTSASGPPPLAWDGTFSEGNIITSQQRPIELLFAR